MAYVRGWVFFDTTSECAYVFQNVLIEIWSTSIKFFATVRRVRVNVKTQLRLDVASARVAYGMAPVAPLVPIVPFAPMIWGRLHPNFSSPPGMKVAWSETELGHLGALCAAILEESPAAESRMCAIALKRIRNDPSSFDVYHERHIFSSARLRVGVIGCRRLGFL